jgi:hypothetical protein
MSFLTKLPIFSGLGLVSHILGLGHKKKPILPAGPATPDDARMLADQQDELRRRKGAAADMLTGTQGAEATGGSVGRLIASN